MGSASFGTLKVRWPLNLELLLVVIDSFIARFLSEYPRSRTQLKNERLTPFSCQSAANAFSIWRSCLMRAATWDQFCMLSRSATSSSARGLNARYVQFAIAQATASVQDCGTKMTWSWADGASARSAP